MKVSSTRISPKWKRCRALQQSRGLLGKLGCPADELVRRSRDGDALDEERGAERPDADLDPRLGSRRAGGQIDPPGRLSDVLKLVEEFQDEGDVAGGTERHAATGRDDVGALVRRRSAPPRSSPITFWRSTWFSTRRTSAPIQMVEEQIPAEVVANCGSPGSAGTPARARAAAAAVRRAWLLWAGSLGNEDRRSSGKRVGDEGTPACGPCCPRRPARSGRRV